MAYKTYGELKSEVLKEADMEAEDFIQASEVLGYFNDAVDEAVAHIHKLGLEDDYFLTKKVYDLVNGQTDLDMPDNIYMTKIRGFVYSTPEKVYPIKRIVGPKRFQIIENLLQNPTGNAYYRYQISNDSATSGFKIELYPPSYETMANCIVMHYVRKANTVVDDNSIIDIPFYQFVKAFVKWKLFGKENGPKADDSKQEYLEQKQLMLETLAEMVPDYGSEIPPDITLYEEMS